MKNKTSLLLSADRSAWSALAHHGTEFDQSSKMVKVRDQVLRRDDHTCQGCGWRSERWQEIHHKNGDHANYAMDNLETLCPLCHQVFHLPTVGTGDSGVIVWLPEIPQAQLNLMCIAMFVAMSDSRSRWRTAAQSLFSQLDTRKTIMDAQFGSAKPADMAQALIRLSPEQYANREKFLAPIRLLPMHSRFETAIAHWASVDFKRHPPEVWEEIIPADFDLAEVVRSQQG